MINVIKALSISVLLVLMLFFAFTALITAHQHVALMLIEPDSIPSTVYDLAWLLLGMYLITHLVHKLDQ